MTLLEWLDCASTKLEAVTSEPLREARLLTAHVLGKTYEDIYFQPNPEDIPMNVQSLLNSSLERRLNHEPLTKIMGYREFWKHRFIVTKDTLDPRPETETIIETFIRLYPDQQAPLRLLDLGTGTGCIIISLLLEYKNATGVGVDVSKDALQVAQQNCTKHDLDGRLTLLESDWFSHVNEEFDVIISNPPYIGREEKISKSVAFYDPPIALYADNAGLAAYEAIALRANKYLKPNGKLILEIGHLQLETVSNVLRNNYFIIEHISKDLIGHSRVIVASMQEL